MTEGQKVGHSWRHSYPVLLAVFDLFQFDFDRVWEQKWKIPPSEMSSESWNGENIQAQLPTLHGPKVLVSDGGEGWHLSSPLFTGEQTEALGLGQTEKEAAWRSMGRFRLSTLGARKAEVPASWREG